MPEESTQPISYKCANCGVPLESPAEFGGRVDVCPRCGNTCQVPMNKQQKAEQSLRRRRERREQAERRRMARAQNFAARRREREARRAAGRTKRKVGLWTVALIAGAGGFAVATSLVLLVAGRLARHQAMELAKARHAEAAQRAVQARAAKLAAGRARQAAREAAQAQAVRIAAEKARAPGGVSGGAWITLNSGA